MDEMKAAGPPAGRKTTRRNPRRCGTFAAPEVIAEWKRNRYGETLRVTLQTFNGRDVFDLRSWWSDNGYRRPGKGICCSVAHLPAIAKAVNAALERVRALGLLNE